MAQTELTCIQCPIGCPLQLTHEGKEIFEVSGFSCKRGDKYARQEFVDPRRSLSTTIPIDNGLWARLPVKASKPVPKDQVLKVARAIQQLRVMAPVELGEILLENILGFEGIHVVALRNMPKT